MSETQTLEYWKSQAQSWQSKYEETRQELEEFTSSSQELEQELEHELKDSQQQHAILKSDYRGLQEEARQLKEQEQRSLRRIEALEDQVKNYDVQKQSIFQYRRELEQRNDELETSLRNLTSSLSDHTKRIENLIEENSLLQSDLEQTRGQKEVEQRLRDELKDLQDELAVRKKADDSRQATQRERRRTIDEKFLKDEQDIFRLQSIASGDFTNGHDFGDLHKGCKDREAELSSALESHVNSRVVIQNLLRTITALESKLLEVQRKPLRSSISLSHK